MNSGCRACDVLTCWLLFSGLVLMEAQMQGLTNFADSCW